MIMFLQQISLLLISLSLGECLANRFEILTDDFGHTIGRVPDPESETDEDTEDYDELHDATTTTATAITEDDDEDEQEEEKEASQNNENDDDEEDSLFDQATMMNQSRSTGTKGANSTGSVFDGDGDDDDGDHVQPQLPPESSQRLAPLGKLNDITKSLIIKVYRGPTKMIEQKPFASWGYFIKFPNI